MTDLSLRLWRGGNYQLSRFFGYILILSCASLLATPSGKVDIGPTYVDLDLFQEKTNIKHTHFKGIGGKALFFFDGLVPKATFLAAEGNGDGDLLNATFSLGYQIPFYNFCFIPQAGGLFYKIRSPAKDLLYYDDKKVLNLLNGGVFIGIDLLYSLCDWTLTFSYQYGWSYSRIEHHFVDFSFSEHFDELDTVNNFSAQVDYYINPALSFNIIWAMNLYNARNKKPHPIIMASEHDFKVNSFRIGFSYNW